MVELKLAIISSEDFDDYELVCKNIKDEGLNPSLIMSDDINLLGKKYADDNNIPKKMFPAGVDGNKSMIDAANMVLIFHDGESSDIENSVKYAEEKGKFMVVIYYKSIM